MAIRNFPESGDYLTFIEEFLMKNEPCIFPEVVTREWRARQEWQSDGIPDIDYLTTQFGDAIVPVADCSKEHFDSHCKKEMKMADYLDYWRRHMVQRGNETGEVKKDEGLLYLKDWHFVKQYPEYKAYLLLPYFIPDWLNEAWDSRIDTLDDYRFVYFGPKGTWTPLHADVFRSYSWSANVCGRKEWLLFPPGDENKLRDRHGRLPFDLRKHLPHQPTSCLRVVQEAGEVIFIPSGWYHQVHNVEDTISINHNWINAFGARYMWKHIHSELQEVKREISDCRDMVGWEQHCQVVLRTCCGIDYQELLQMLCVLAKPRLSELDTLLLTTVSIPTTPHLPSLLPLRQAITSLASDHVVFVDKSLSRDERRCGSDNVKHILESCITRRTNDRSCVHTLVEYLPDDWRRPLDIIHDVLTRTRCIFLMFELYNIATVLSELSTDPDMQSLKHIYSRNTK